MKLPVVSGMDVIKFLGKRGFVMARRNVTMKKIIDGKLLATTVPLHRRLDPGTLHGILKKCEIREEETGEL